MIYSYNPDKNGEFIVNSNNDNNSTDSDYTLVKFTLNKESDFDENLFRPYQNEAQDLRNLIFTTKTSQIP